jgi:hypothetical protein
VLDLANLRRPAEVSLPAPPTRRNRPATKRLPTRRSRRAPWDPRSQLDLGGGDAVEAAGWPFFGQLIAHDTTADRSPIAGAIGPDRLRNARSPRLDLEMLCSDGPIGSPYLFDRHDPNPAPTTVSVPSNTRTTDCP